MFFNGEGFHNHISHGLLTIWDLGASPAEIQQSYELNRIFQRPQERTGDELSSDLTDNETFMKYMGDDKYYTAFLKFFAREIDRSSW